MVTPPAFPLYDSPERMDAPCTAVSEYITQISTTRVPDASLIYEHGYDWLFAARHTLNNFKAYRSELTTFLHWCFMIEEISVFDVKRSHLARYIDWCEEPDRALIATFNVPQFKDHNGMRVPNEAWRPFKGRKADNGETIYQITESALKSKLAVLSTFFTYLIDEEVMERNPAAALLRSGRFRGASQATASGEDDEHLKAFTELQWSYVMAEAEKMAQEDPSIHERTLFIVSLMYGCYLRISEVAGRPGYSPIMSQFRRDPKTGVWGFFIPSSKGGKRRTVAVSNELLDALKRYRTYLGLSALPSPDEKTPLFIRHKKTSHGRDEGLLNANLGIRQIRDTLRLLFERAADAIAQDGFDLDAAEMRVMTPHSLRHTGISHDINLNGRPLSHVQADAGHDSIDTTSRYLHTTRTERHESAAGKKLNRLA
ncbi:tyrosine-type recombinase/integrase [Marinobacterium sp. BA1]|uniref:tyrosine-type recombinase/integrase n=1 Tax=Marinobacterium sp. BA1 TaxID=3138931 RepID=UPI0034E888CE